MKIIEMIKKCFRNNESGFSLAELMVAAGIVGVISVALMRIMTQATQTQKKVTTDMTINEIYINMQNILRNEDNCTKQFGGKAYAAGTTPQLSQIIKWNSDQSAAIQTYGVHPDPTSAIGIGTDGKTWITGIVVSNTPPPAPITAGRGEITLDVTFSRINPVIIAAGGEAYKSAKKRTYGGRSVRKQIKIQVDVTGATITKCNADLSDYQEQFCQTALQGTWNGTNCESIQISNGGATGNAINTTGAINLDSDSGQLDGNKLAFTTAGKSIGLMGAAQLNAAVPVYTNSMRINTDDMTFQKNILLVDGYRLSVDGETHVNRNFFGFTTAGKSIGLLPVAQVDAAGPVFTNNMQINASDMTFSDSIIVNANSTVVSNSTVGKVLTVSGTGVANTSPSLNVVNGQIRVTDVQSTGVGSYTAMDGFANNATTRTVVPNVKWVSDYVTGTLSNSVDDNAVAKLIQAMANKVADTPLDALSNYMCGKFNYGKRTDSGATTYSTGTPYANGNCNITPDVNCSNSGSCTRVCIGTDCRTAWPAPDGICSTYNKCSQVCVRTTCRTHWPKLVFGGLNIGRCRWSRTYVSFGSSGFNTGRRYAYCYGQGVVRGIYHDGNRTDILCCGHRTENGTAGNNQWSTY